MKHTEWYRFTGPAGTQLPTSPPPGGPPNGCQNGQWNTSNSLFGWRASGSGGGIVSRKICFQWGGNTCDLHNYARVAACYSDAYTQETYYIYEFNSAISCSGYCAITK